MVDDRRDPDDVAAELAETLRALQRELEPRRRPPRRFRPPTPREVLRFADEFAIPALVAGLEATVRALELLQGVIRLVDGRPVDPDRRRDEVADAGRAALDRLDDLLSDLGDALEGEAADPEARRLLAEARELRTELDTALDAPPGDGPGREVPVDVEGELQSLKDQVDDDEQ